MIHAERAALRAPGSAAPGLERQLPGASALPARITVVDPGLRWIWWSLGHRIFRITRILQDIFGRNLAR